MKNISIYSHYYYSLHKTYVLGGLGTAKTLTTIFPKLHKIELVCG
jgi:hypothetical protein